MTKQNRNIFQLDVMRKKKGYVLKGHNYCPSSSRENNEMTESMFSALLKPGPSTLKQKCGWEKKNHK